MDYQGQTQISIWEKPEYVSGTDGTQFAPHSSSNTFFVWVPDFLRDVPVTQTQSSISLYGIKLNRFQIPSFVLASNENYYQPYVGFANMSAAFSGVPIWLSKPDMLDADPTFINKISGMNPDPDTDDTYLDVEPITGKSNKLKGVSFF